MPEYARDAGCRRNTIKRAEAMSSPRMRLIAWGARRSYMYDGEISKGTLPGGISFHLS
jgi:hypothetical protein